MKYGELNLGQIEAVVNKLGGMDGVNRLLADELTISPKNPNAPALTTEQKFAKWRNFLIGGVAKKALLARVKSGYEVGTWAEDMTKQNAFTTLDAEEEIETIILAVSDFGYERQPTTAELFDPTRLAEWSKQNAHRLPEGYVVDLLPAEAGLHIRDQYKDQPKGEVLWIAMERITDSGGGPGVVNVGRDGGGERWLGSGDAGAEGQWPLGDRFVFRLRKVAQA
jgi:hypothetical protein